MYGVSSTSKFSLFFLFTKTGLKSSSKNYPYKMVANLGFPGSSDDKVSAYNAGDPGSIPGSGRSPAEGNGSPLQYSCLENPKDGGA